MAYVIDGKLYLQDGSHPSVQLTSSGEDRSPVFSDDGERLVFYRGVLSHNVYMINADGSQEQALVTRDLLTSLGLGYDASTELRSMAFIPGTHQLLFNTHQFQPTGVEPDDANRLSAKPNQDLLLVDADTAEIKQLLAPGQGGIFQVSPDGKLIGVQTLDHIEVIGLDGQLIHNDLATYPAAWLYNSQPDIYWAQDSSRLSVVLPIPTGSALDSPGPQPRTVWQYFMNGGPVTQIQLSPPPIGNSFSISPDGDWIAYTYYYYPGQTDPATATGTYIGRLPDGGSQLAASVESYGLPESFRWSPDNTHFIFSNEQSQLFLGDVSGQITPLAAGQFLGWINDRQYLYLAEKIFLGEIGKETNQMVTNIPANVPYTNSAYFAYIVVEREPGKEK